MVYTASLYEHRVNVGSPVRPELEWGRLYGGVSAAYLKDILLQSSDFAPTRLTDFSY